jgi:hypothetical protein
MECQTRHTPIPGWPSRRSGPSPARVSQRVTCDLATPSKVASTREVSCCDGRPVSLHWRTLLASAKCYDHAGNTVRRKFVSTLTGQIRCEYRQLP